ncbi:MAG: hypothetical protein JST39_19640 [Bacteroidetes bacterium]|nr:hypothetical protein [Bacteroidota bacterium]
MYSEPEREDSRRTSFEIIGKMNGNFLVYKSNRSDDAICIYDADMKLKERVKLEFTPEQLINVDFVAYPDFFYMIYQYQKKGIVHCAAAKLDPAAHTMMEPIELDTTQIGWSSGNKIYTTVNSDDKQRIMVFKINSKNTKNFVFTTMLYNANLELLGKHRMNMPMEERNDFFTDFQLSNEGELVFGKCLRQSSNDYVTKVSLVVKYPDSTNFTMNEVETGGRVLDEIKTKIDNTNKRILLSAFYYKQKRGNIEGLYSVIWDRQNNRKIREFANVFSDDLRNNAKSPDGSVRMAFNDFFIKNIIMRRDGGYLLISESEYTTSRNGGFNRWDYMGGGNPWISPMDYYYWSPYSSWGSPWNRWNSGVATRYHAENIMVLSYSADGSVEWTNVIPKSQFDDESDNEVSFQTMNTGGEVHFLFNVPERRGVLMLTDQSLSAEGKITRNPTLKNLDKGYEFMARYGKQVSARQMIMPCLYRNYLCMAKIDF